MLVWMPGDLCGNKMLCSDKFLLASKACGESGTSDLSRRLIFSTKSILVYFFYQSSFSINYIFLITHCCFLFSFLSTRSWIGFLAHLLPIQLFLCNKLLWFKRLSVIVFCVGGVLASSLQLRPDEGPSFAL